MNEHFILFLAVQILISLKFTCLAYIFPLHTLQGGYHPKLWDQKRALLPETATIFGNSSSLNYYYANIYIGNPPQRQALIIDTGSFVTAIPCMPLCKSCGHHINSYYQLQSSNTSRVLNCQEPKCKEIYGGCDEDNQCSFNSAYMEGSSLSGVFFEDIVRFGDNFMEFEPSLMSIGCTRTENNLFFDQQVDGIMGLGPSNLTFVGKLYKNKVISSRLFTLCLAQNGGYFSVGAINSSLHAGKIEYISTSFAGLFHVKLIDIIIDNNDTTFGKEYPTIIDSGTTISYFPQDLFDQLDIKFQNYCSQPNRCMGTPLPKSDLGICFKLWENINSIQFIESLPSLVFVFENGTRYEWPPQSYLFNHTGITFDKEEKPIDGLVYCLGFNAAKSNQILLGSTWMHNHDIIFDMENKQIGFVESKCGDVIGPMPRVNDIRVKPHEVETCENTSNAMLYQRIIYTMIAVLVVIVLVLFYAIYRARKSRAVFMAVNTNPEGIELSRNEVHAGQVIDDVENRGS